MKLFLFLLFLIVSISSCFSGTIDPETPDQKYIEYGSKFHCVLRIEGKYQDQTPFVGSCIAIKPNWIVTAAHVVNGCEYCFIIEKDKKICINKVIINENFVIKNFGEYDIALGKLSDSLSLTFYPDLYTDKNEVGKVCSISGFGKSGTFETGMIRSDGLRRAGSNIIDSISKKLLICSPSKKNKTELEFLIGHGDSGGGLFINNKLAGINSCIMSDVGQLKSVYGNESGHTRVSVYVDWINNIIKSESEEQNEK